MVIAMRRYYDKNGALQGTSYGTFGHLFRGFLWLILLAWPLGVFAGIGAARWILLVLWLPVFFWIARIAVRKNRGEEV
jgi:hypothetical protein